MTLRRKLLTAFFGLTALAVTLAGLTLWTTARWQESGEALRSHYERSLLLQRVRAATFQAMKEVGDALFQDEATARAEFDEALAPASADLARWAELADTDGERAEVEAVRQAHEELVVAATQALALHARGRREAAAELLETRVEREGYARFSEVTDAAVLADQARRAVVRAEVEGVRRTARTALLIAAFAAISLVLLVAAYLASDLFRPLRRVERALQELARGDVRVRLSEGRRDEIGAVQAAFDHLAETLGRREPSGSEVVVPQPAERGDGSPSHALHAVLAQLRAQAARLRQSTGGPAAEEMEALTAAATRAADFVRPLGLELEETDLRDLLYSVHARFRAEFARRSIGTEVWVEPSLGDLVLDQARLREALSETVRNALAALPAQGGRIGLRALRGPDGRQVLLEVADDGPGLPADATAGLADDDPIRHRAVGGTPDRPRLGLPLARWVAERHGGSLRIISEGGSGTIIRFALPLQFRRA
jgi:signal transduction histidine kinase